MITSGEETPVAPVVAEYPPPDPFGDADPYAGGYEPTAGQLRVFLKSTKRWKGKTYPSIFSGIKINI